MPQVRLVETTEPALACPGGGAVVEVTSPGSPGVDVRADAPRRAYCVGARARYVGARLEPGRYDSPPGPVPWEPVAPAGFPQGRGGGPVPRRIPVKGVEPSGTGSRGCCKGHALLSR
jgi:hypothetical protein